MPLEVHYTNHKAWNADTKKFADPKLKQEADDIGHFLMTIGVSEITKKTIGEIIIRKIILDRFYPNSKELDKLPGDWYDIFSRHLGLKIEGRWAGNESRWKFASRHAKGMIRDIENKVETEI